MVLLSLVPEDYLNVSTKEVSAPSSRLEVLLPLWQTPGRGSAQAILTLGSRHQNRFVRASAAKLAAALARLQPPMGTGAGSERDQMPIFRGSPPLGAKPAPQTSAPAGASISPPLEAPGSSGATRVFECGTWQLLDAPVVSEDQVQKQEGGGSAPSRAKVDAPQDARTGWGIIAEAVAHGMNDNWSLVRFAAVEACGSLMRAAFGATQRGSAQIRGHLATHPLNEVLDIALPPLILNRYFSAAGVSSAANAEWRGMHGVGVNSIAEVEHRAVEVA